MQHFYDGIAMLRQAIHEAEPKWPPPYDYMNLMHPLTPLTHRLAGGEMPPRLAALRHGLKLLDECEEVLRGLESSKEVHPDVSAFVTMSIGIVMGIMWAHAIEPKSVSELVDKYRTIVPSTEAHGTQH